MLRGGGRYRYIRVICAIEDGDVEKRKCDGKSYGIILKEISKVILASVRIQEEKRDKAEEVEGKKENYSKEGKVPEGFGLGFWRMRSIRTVSAGNYSCVNKRDRCISRK